MEIKFLFILIIVFIIDLKKVQCRVNCSDELNMDYPYFIEEQKHNIRIPLYRQKTPLEQQLNSPLRIYGIHFDWLNTDNKPKPPKPPRTNDSIAIYRFLNREFYAPIVIGHPGQTLNVVFDTTWAYTWVISSKCNGLTDIGCYFHNKYDHSRSSEYKPDGKKFHVNGGTYNMSGFFSYENISVAHSNVTNFSFIEMTELPKTFIFDKADGVIGLGLPLGDYNPFFTTLVKQKNFSSIFSIYYNRDHSMDHGSTKAGNILLGFMDKKHIKCSEQNGKKVYDKIVTVPKESDTPYWQFIMDEISIDFNAKNSTSMCTKCTGIIDSSSSTIMGPKDQVDKIHDIIEARRLVFGKYMVKCDTLTKLPKISFMIGGEKFTLNGEQYVTKLTWEGIIFCISAFETIDSTGESKNWILGAAFLSEVYTIYNTKDKNIGFVHSA